MARSRSPCRLQLVSGEAVDVGPGDLGLAALRRAARLGLASVELIDRQGRRVVEGAEPLGEGEQGRAEVI